MRLKELRINNDLKQKDIANILDVKRGTYASWESNTDTIPTLQVYKLANYYNKSIDYILEISNNNKDIYYNNDINKELIGNRIKEIRIDNNLSQNKFAKSIFINQSTLWAYEKGQTLITTNNLISIAKEYKVSIDYILGRCNK